MSFLFDVANCSDYAGMAPCSSYFTSKVKYFDAFWISRILGFIICLGSPQRGVDGEFILLFYQATQL